MRFVLPGSELLLPPDPPGPALHQSRNQTPYRCLQNNGLSKNLDSKSSCFQLKVQTHVNKWIYTEYFWTIGESWQLFNVHF